MMFSNTLNNDQKALIIQIIITTTSSSIFFFKTCVFKFPKTARLSFHHPCGHRCACFMNPKVILHIHVFFFVFAQSKNISKQILVNEAYCPFKNVHFKFSFILWPRGLALSSSFLWYNDEFIAVRTAATSNHRISTTIHKSYEVFLKSCFFVCANNCYHCQIMLSLIHPSRANYLKMPCICVFVHWQTLVFL